MVGLRNMESKMPVCSYCKIQANTRCDKTDTPICPDCSTIVPNGDTVLIYAKRHAPKSHVNKMMKLAIKRGLFDPNGDEKFVL
tara:strand:- start:248 stop:496 length:249 start_codon:yes stop_codon:yes gene_type:complete